ncbi:MAG TPA: hypothetical protein VFA58_08975, partial [Chthoniobacterales bacterium]|nr:hypothetical protein [Chthoniobacterales bacterium]
SIDFARFDIRVVSVENAYADGQFELTLNNNGYDLIAVIGDDDIYLRKTSQCPSKQRRDN